MEGRGEVVSQMKGPGYDTAASETVDELSWETLGLAPGRGRLEGRRVLVVGAGTALVEGCEATTGNGRAIAILAAREGAQVACADKNEDSARETLETIKNEGNGGCVIVGDVTNPGDCERIVDEAVTTLGGPLQGLVLNVGMLGPVGLAATSLDVWDLILATNLRSHAILAAHSLPLMTPNSAIVFMSSLAAIVPGVGMPAYDATKAAVAALARHTAGEGAVRRIRANAILPGAVDTPIGAASRRGRDVGKTPIPLGRRGTPWDVAYGVIFLLSDESAYITAQSLVVDGGASVLFNV